MNVFLIILFGLEIQNFQSVCNWIEPSFFQNSKNFALTPTILLKGAPANGKTLIAKLVAKKFGIHFVEVNCWESKSHEHLILVYVCVALWTF